MSGIGVPGQPGSRGPTPANPKPGAPPDGVAGSSALATGSDPSMEDILASIRRILSEDEQAGARAAEPAAADPRASPAEPHAPEVFNLDASMMVDEAPEPESIREPSNPEPVRPESARPETPRPAATPPQPAPPIPPPLPPPPSVGADSLVAPAAAAAAAMSLGSLRRTLETERPSLPRSSGLSVEELVREALRPVLKAWLDEHLAPIVERLVRAEIERVVGRTES